jgi:cytosine/adenosine deaminase-related metal-dependent hydrolase
MFSKPVSLVNATVLGVDGRVYDSVRIAGAIVDALGAPPQRDDVVVDVGNDLVVPGLINAHDHLELNSFPRLKWRSHYGNVREWIADFQPRFTTDPDLAAARPGTLADRVWVGGLKNLLSGVTTVCHHNPFHRWLHSRFPVRVIRTFGMSHSLQIDGALVAASYRNTPGDWPWVIHAAEGIDAAAREEIGTLDAMGCIGPNTVLVHGVGIGDHEAEQVLSRGAALVWCPSSNEFLFGQTATVGRFAERRSLALGTDSRLSGEGDLLDEMRAAHRTRQLTPEMLVRAVTVDAAAVLRLPDAGRIEVGRPADLAVVRRIAGSPFECLVGATRADVRLTMIDGAPLIADARMTAVFDARRERYMRAQVDGVERFVARWIGKRAAGLTFMEPGFEVAA